MSALGSKGLNKYQEISRPIQVSRLSWGWRGEQKTWQHGGPTLPSGLDSFMPCGTTVPSPHGYSRGLELQEALALETCGDAPAARSQMAGPAHLSTSDIG